MFFVESTAASIIIMVIATKLMMEMVTRARHGARHEPSVKYQGEISLQF